MLNKKTNILINKTTKAVANLKNKHFSDESQFTLEKIKEGCGVAVIFIDGFLSEEKNNTIDWESQLKDIYPENPWYCVKWEAENLKAIGKNIGLLVASRTMLGKAAVSATPIGLPLTTVALLKNPWSKAFKKAKLTGELLGESISMNEQTYILCGHSLGARVIYFTLDYLVKNNKKMIEDVHLLGGAVDNKRKHWANAKEGVHGTINNYKSSNDKVLSIMYKMGTLFTSNPIGINSIDVEGINNIDVSHIVDGHTKYKNNFSQFVQVDVK